MQGHPHELIWVAPQYEHRPKEVSWYWASIILAIALLAFAVWQKNYLFAIFIVIAEMLVLVWAGEEPRLVKFTLNEKELRIGERKSFRMSEFLHYSVEDLDHKEWANLVVHSNRPLHAGTKVHVPKHHLPDVRHIFETAGVPESDRKESMIDTLEEFLGF